MFKSENITPYINIMWNKITRSGLLPNEHKELDDFTKSELKDLAWVIHEQLRCIEKHS